MTCQSVRNCIEELDAIDWMSKKNDKSVFRLKVLMHNNRNHSNALSDSVELY